MLVHVLGHRHEVAADASERTFDNSERAFGSVHRDAFALEPHATLIRARYHFLRTHFIVKRKLVRAHEFPACIMGAGHTTKSAARAVIFIFEAAVAEQWISGRH